MVDFGFQGGFQGFVGVVRSKEVCVADEEGFHVVVGIDEPAGYALCSVAADFACFGVEDVNTGDFYLNLVISGVADVDVGFAEDDEEVAFAGIFEVSCHVEVGVRADF